MNANFEDMDVLKNEVYRLNVAIAELRGRLESLEDEVEEMQEEAEYNS